MRKYLEFTLKKQVIILVITSIIILFFLSIFYSNYIEIFPFFTIKPYVFSETNPFVDFYQKNLRGYLFSGFISVGSFLLSLHSFVITNMRDKVYLTQEYQELFAENNNCSVENIDKKKLLKPLDNLSWFINCSVILAIVTAIFQFTLGLYAKPIVALICVYFAILSIVFMLNALILIRINIKIMLHQYN